MEQMSHEFVDPVRVGTDPEEVAILMRRARLEVQSGHLPACQVALGKDRSVSALPASPRQVPTDDHGFGLCYLK